MKTVFAVAIGVALVMVGTRIALVSAMPMDVERLGWVLVHSVWLLTSVALLAALVDRLLRRRSANVRYVALVASLALMIASPCVVWLLVDLQPGIVETSGASAAEALAPPEETDARTIVASNPADLGFRGGPLDSLEQGHETFGPDGQPLPAAPRSSEFSLSLASVTAFAKASFGAFGAVIEPTLPLIVLLWFAGVALFATRPIVGLRSQWRLGRDGLSPAPESVERSLADLARRLGLRHAVRVAESARVKVPMAVGYLKPMILLPACVLTGLTPTQLQALLAHELAHIRRNDWLVNAIQVLIETLLFYHPAVWWLSRRIRQERENCCDDVALSLIADRPSYGRMLLSLEELRQRIPQPALAATGGALAPRVRRLLAGPIDPQPAARGWLSGAVLLGLITLASALWTTSGAKTDEAVDDASTAVAKEDSDRGDPASPVAAPNEIKDLIAKVRENEALYINLDATVTTSRTFHVQKGGGASTEFNPAGPFVKRTNRETYRMVTQGGRFFFSGEEEIGLASGKMLPAKQTIVFDGTQTVAIAEGNSATVFRGQHEAARMFPPHCWGIFTLDVNFPLSVYLEGTEALQSHPKVARLPVEQGSVFEFNKVESEFIGEENVDGLACVKVEVRRWYYTKSPPAIQVLWLAKDRNYHVVRCRTSFLRKGKEVIGAGSRVTKWREIATGVWLPSAVEMRSPPPTDETSRALQSTRSLHIEHAALNPTMPAGFFDLPEIPDSLPKFVVGRDGRLEDSPQRVRPAQTDADMTLDSILQRLAEEEAKYDRYEVETVERYEHLNRSDMSSGGLHTVTETRERSIVARDRLYYKEEKDVKLAGGDRSSLIQRQAYDGQWTRGTYSYDPGNENGKKEFNASLALGGPGEVRLLRPHATVFRRDRSRQVVSRFLKSRSNQMVVEYVGDEKVGGLHCHKLKCELPTNGNANARLWFFLWLARDRNLVPIRHEWHEMRKSVKLPAGIRFVNDLREIRPGLWFPYRTTHLSFQSFSGEGLAVNRPLLQWRRDIVVESLTLDPVVDDALFERVEVPAGTTVTVKDERGARIGRYTQAEAGNIDIAPEQLLELRRKAEIKKDEAKGRRKAQ